VLGLLPALVCIRGNFACSRTKLRHTDSYNTYSGYFVHQQNYLILSSSLPNLANWRLNRLREREEKDAFSMQGLIVSDPKSILGHCRVGLGALFIQEFAWPVVAFDPRAVLGCLGAALLKEFENLIR
jgi:hypothetical protein